MVDTLRQLTAEVKNWQSEVADFHGIPEWSVAVGAVTLFGALVVMSPFMMAVEFVLLSQIWGK